MNEETEKKEQNTDTAENPETGEGVKTEDHASSAANVLDDDIEYTFVVPRGEIYVDPDLPSAEPEPEPEAQEQEVHEAAPTIVMDRRKLTENVPEPPVYAATGLPEGDDIIYTFVVPKGEVYHEPDPDEEGSEETGSSPENGQGVPAKTIVVTKNRKGDESGGDGYGLPEGHSEIGELARKQEARRQYKQKKRNSFRTRFYVVLTAIALLVCWLILSSSGLFTIDAIVVQGNSHYTAEEIINMGHASPGRNIIYKANIKETTEYLENNPYIRHAEVRRRLPSTLVIKVTERQERLAFKYDDDYLIMDEDGILLKKTRNEPKTTIVKGLVVSKIKLGEKIGTENNKLLNKVLTIIKTMIKSDLFFVRLDVSKEKTVKAYIYDTLVVKTDYDSLITNMKNGKLHLVLEKLFSDGIKRGTITFEEDGSASFMPIF